MRSDPEEMRLTKRVLHRWRELAGGRPFPTPVDISPAAFGADWHNCLLIRIGPAREPILAYIGDAVRRTAEICVGSLLDSCPPDTLIGRATSYLPRVLEKRAPVAFGGSISSEEMLTLYRSILLPLSADGGVINEVLGAANCRDVAFRREDELDA